MNDPKPISRADLARHWKVSPPYVSKLGRSIAEGGKAMPEFFSIAEADSWRTRNCPPRPEFEAHRNSTNNPPPSAGKIAQSKTPQQPSGRESPPETPPSPPERTIDVMPFVDHGADFTSLMIRQAKEVPQIAHGLWKDACRRQSHSEIDRTLSTWTDAAKAAAGILNDYLELQEKSKALIPIDVVMDIVGTELQAIRTRMLKFGEQVGPKANPDNPILAVTVINTAIDDLFKSFEHAENISAAELVAG
jgi:hypothetical protein